MTTDGNGKVYLGKLNFVTKIEAYLNPQGSSTQYWDLQSFKQILNYPDKLYCKLGEKVSLAVDPSWSVKDVIFYNEIGNKFVSQDMSEDVTVDEGELVLPIFSGLLPAGTTSTLWLLPINKKIEVRILEGSRME